MINMFGNKKFQKLVEILQREEKLFPIDFPNHFGTKWIKPLREKILEERGRGSTETIDFFEEHFNNLEVKGLLRLKQPQITDYSNLLGLRSGKVYGLELRLMGPSGSHKDIAIASLLAMKLMTRGLPIERLNTLVDSGIANSLNAVYSYSKNFGLKGVYYIPEDTPKSLVPEGQNFEVIGVLLPNEQGRDKKNATYRALLRKLQEPSFRERAFYLGHAELGFFSTYPIGRSFVSLFEREGIVPEIFLTPVGAGTTLVGIGEPLQNAYGTEIVIGEYIEFTPVKNRIPDRFKGIINDYPEIILSETILNTKGKYSSARGIISRQLQLNPFIPEDFWEKVSGIYHIAPNIDGAVLEYLHDKGFDIGLTSAGALSIASRIEDKEGKTIVVPIFERFRDYRPNN